MADTYVLQVAAQERKVWAIRDTDLDEELWVWAAHLHSRDLKA